MRLRPKVLAGLVFACAVHGGAAPVLATDADDIDRELETIKRSPVHTTIEVRQSDKPSSAILMNVKFVNSAKSPVRLEKWLALDPPEVEVMLLRIR